jgi:hypothetical protein
LVSYSFESVVDNREIDIDFTHGWVANVRRSDAGNRADGRGGGGGGKEDGGLAAAFVAVAREAARANDPATTDAVGAAVGADELSLSCRVARMALRGLNFAGAQASSGTVADLELQQLRADGTPKRTLCVSALRVSAPRVSTAAVPRANPGTGIEVAIGAIVLNDDDDRTEVAVAKAAAPASLAAQIVNHSDFAVLVRTAQWGAPQTIAPHGGMHTVRAARQLVLAIAPGAADGSAAPVVPIWSDPVPLIGPTASCGGPVALLIPRASHPHPGEPSRQHGIAAIWCPADRVLTVGDPGGSSSPGAGAGARTGADRLCGSEPPNPSQSASTRFPTSLIKMMMTPSPVTVTAESIDIRLCALRARICAAGPLRASCSQISDGTGGGQGTTRGGSRASADDDALWLHDPELHLMGPLTVRRDRRDTGRGDDPTRAADDAAGDTFHVLVELPQLTLGLETTHGAALVLLDARSGRGDGAAIDWRVTAPARCVVRGDAVARIDPALVAEVTRFVCPGARGALHGSLRKAGSAVRRRDADTDRATDLVNPVVAANSAVLLAHRHALTLCFDGTLRIVWSGCASGDSQTTALPLLLALCPAFATGPLRVPRIVYTPGRSSSGADSMAGRASVGSLREALGCIAEAVWDLARNNAGKYFVEGDPHSV